MTMLSYEKKLSTLLFILAMLLLNSLISANEGKRDSLFCHDSNNYLRKFKNGDFEHLFNKSKLERIMSLDTSIVFAQGKLIIKNQSTNSMTIGIRNGRVFIKNLDTTFWILDSRIELKYSDKTQVLLEAPKDGFAVFTFGTISFKVSYENRIAEMLFFEDQNRSIFITFTSIRRSKFFMDINIHCMEGNVKIFFYNKSDKPFVIYSGDSSNSYSIGISFSKRKSQVESIKHSYLVEKGDDPRAPNYEYEYYYIYDRKGKVYFEHSVKVNYCQ
jgi:hypothetical protein